MFPASGRNEYEDVVLRKKAPTTAQLKSTKAINNAQRRGIEIETNKKQNAATNKQHASAINTLKLDLETDVAKIKTVDMSVGKIIQQARQSKGLNQKDLATKICEKPQIIGEYENGKAIPNPQILSKLEKALGVKLRGKDKGKPLGGAAKPAAK